MRILVTAGNSQTPIDQVRCITNIFSGRTGTQIALRAASRGEEVCLLTSHPEVIEDLARVQRLDLDLWRVEQYRTFSDLHKLLESEIRHRSYDAVIHAAAVSDFEVAGVYAAGEGTRFSPESAQWIARDTPQLAPASAGKIKSSHAELWLRLVPTLKLISLVRDPWGFRGVLVMFKLEVGASEPELLRVAEQSRLQSHADLMVANTLEGMKAWAMLGPCNGEYRRITRDDLPDKLLDAVSELHWKPR